MVIWLVGLSGSGKTTIGRLLYDHIKSKKDNVVFLDGDILREVWGESLGHDLEGRRLNAHRISHLCKMLDAQGITVVAAVLSIFPEWQEWNRNNFTEYNQIHLNAPISDLKRRDTKMLYKKAELGVIRNVVGVDIAFPQPFKSDLVVDTSAVSGGPEKTFKEIIDHLEL